MKIFCTGAKGYIGKALAKAGVLPLTCDVTKLGEVEKELVDVRPDLVFHLAGKSSIEFCQKPENKEVVIQSNVRGTHNVMSTLARLRLKGVLLSTDQIWHGGIFEGKHKEDSKLTPPVNFYATSKLAAEAVTIACGMNVIRSSYVFDWDRISKGLAESDMTYPTFIQRSFTYLPEFVEDLLLYAKKFHDMPPTLHLASNEAVSWYAFMKTIGEEFGFRVKPRFFEQKGYAPRPHYGGLDTRLSFRLGFPVRNYYRGILRMKNES